MKNKKYSQLIVLVISMMLIIASIGQDTLIAKAYDTSIYNAQTFAPVFNAEYYLARYPELKSTYGTDENALFEHFLFTGMAEGRQASVEFNVLVYMKENPDLRQTFGNDITSYYLHYIGRGKAEKRIAYSKDETLTYYDYFKDFYNNYFKDTVFLGDSIMLGYRNFCGRQKGTYLTSIKFLCAGSYSLNNALKPVTSTNLHPIYKGEKVSVWEGIHQMNAKHVYIMFGTNDLAITGVDGTVNNYVKVIDNIKKLNPDVDINIISMTYTVADYKGRGLNNNNIKLFNDKLKTLCELNGYHYIDLAEKIDDGTGNLNPGYCSDGFVHLNFTCYANAWKPTFEKAAAESVYKELFGE